MEIKRFIRRIIIFSLIIFFMYFIQISIFSKLPVGGVTPNIVLGVTSIFGFMKGRKRGLLTGFVCGILLDFTSGLLFGVMALIYMTIGFINGLFRKAFYGDDIKLPMLLIFSSNVIYGFLMIATCLFMHTEVDMGYFIGSVVLPESVYTMLVCIPVYYLIYFISNKLDKEEKRRENHFVT